MFLVVSSTDGYCTFVTFTPGELGSPYKTQVVKTKTKEEVAEERQADVRQKKMKKKHKKGHAMETDKKTTLLEEKVRIYYCQLKFGCPVNCSWKCLL